MAVLDQSATLTGVTMEIGGRDGGAPQLARAQSFTTAKANLYSVIVKKVTTIGTPTGNLVFEIRTDSSNLPSSTVLATKSFTPAQWNAFSNGEIEVILRCPLAVSTKYWLVSRDDAVESSQPNYYIIDGTLTGETYTGGNNAYSLNNGTSWTAQTYDHYFKTYASEIKSVNGLALASIKSVNGLAIGSIKSINGLQ